MTMKRAPEMEPFFVAGHQQAEPSVVSDTSIFACGKLRDGDLIRYVSPASTPEKQTTLKRAQALEALGFQIDFGPHAFSKYAWMAGTDDERIADLNNAFRDPQERAIFATRGGKGSYRIAACWISMRFVVTLNHSLVSAISPRCV